MLKMGILDPTKVTRTALQNAASIAGLMITTEAMVTEQEKDDEAAKRKLVRETLQRQLSEQANEQKALRENAKKMDQMILERAQAELDAEAKKKEELKAKTLAAKAERDRQLREVKNKIE